MATVKVIIECDGKVVVKQGDLIMGGVVTRAESGYDIDAHFIGKADSSHVAELAATLCVNTVTTALCDTPFKKMMALLELPDLIKEEIAHQIERM